MIVTDRMIEIFLRCWLKDPVAVPSMQRTGDYQGVSTKEWYEDARQALAAAIKAGEDPDFRPGFYGSYQPEGSGESKAQA